MTSELKKKKYLDYINPRIIMSYGIDFAIIMQKAYSSQSAEDKLQSTKEIYEFLGIKDEVKVKFIGDIMVKPKSRRIAISQQLIKLIKESSIT